MTKHVSKYDKLHEMEFSTQDKLTGKQLIWNQHVYRCYISMLHSLKLCFALEGCVNYIRHTVFCIFTKKAKLFNLRYSTDS